MWAKKSHCLLLEMTEEMENKNFTVHFIMLLFIPVQVYIGVGDQIKILIIKKFTN